MLEGFLIFFVTLTVSFMIAYLSVSSRLSTVNQSFMQMYLSNQMLQDFIESNKINAKSDIEEMHKENFIKFLSDSRDWAFDYIESSQKTIEEVANKLDELGFKEDANKLYVLLPENKGN